MCLSSILSIDEKVCFNYLDFSLVLWFKFCLSQEIYHFVHFYLLKYTIAYCLLRWFPSHFLASVATQYAPQIKGVRNIPFNLNDQPSPLGPLKPEELLVAIHLLEFAKDPLAPPSSNEGKMLLVVI